MEIQEKVGEKTLTLAFSGEMDHHGARDALRRIGLAIDAALPGTLTLDFEGVTFMDSSGIALILRAQKRMKLLDGTVILCNASPQVKRVLEAAGIPRFVTLKNKHMT